MTTTTTTPMPLTDIELNAWLRSPGSQNYAAAAEIRALRAERDDLLAVARMVLDCRDSHPATGNRVFLDYRDWEGTKEAARVVIARAEGRAE